MRPQVPAGLTRRIERLSGMIGAVAITGTIGTLALLVAAQITYADVAGTGALELHFDASTGDFIGSIVFDNRTYTVLGGAVNLGEDVGSLDLVGSAPLSNNNGGTFSVSMSSTTPGLLSYVSSGGYVCRDPEPGCTPDDAAFIGDVSSMSGSVVGSVLPVSSTLFYVGDGGTTCGPIVDLTVDCAGTYALNVFESIETPSGLGVKINKDSTFVNPFTGEVTPLNVQLSFDAVDTAGDTVISGLSLAPGLVPSNFVLEVPGFQALYFDIKSTATFSGFVEVCISYADDAPADGVLDGTTVPETSLRLLHEEGGIFVDRTTSLDEAANILCGEVTSFSSFVVPVLAPNYCDPAPLSPASCRATVPGRASLQIKSKNGKNQIKWKWRNGEQTFGSAYDNPVTNQNQPRYTLCIYNAADNPQLIFDGAILGGGQCDGRPCWKGSAAKGFKFKNKRGNEWGMSAAKLKPGVDGKAQVKIQAKGAALDPPALPLAGGGAPVVTAQLIVDNGTTPECWSATYTAIKKNDQAQFMATGQ